MLQNIEELSLNAWPSLQTVFYDGWILRFAQGYTRRSNSINPIYPSRIDPAQKIAFCELLYRQNHLPVIFKLAGQDESRQLDTFLRDEGYQDEAYTSVQVADLGDFKTGEIGAIEINAELDPKWEEVFSRIHLLENNQRKIHQRMLLSIIPTKAFVSIRKRGQIIGCGLGVLQGTYLGIFDIVIDHEQRGQGYGEALMRGLMAWGKSGGAHSAYLQVMLDNSPALSLYQKLGYHEAYQYWYRVKG